MTDRRDKGPAEARNWQFTLNNPVDYLAWPFKDQVYGVYQLELAPRTGTPHFQGYIAFSKPKGLTALRKLLPGAHLEIAQGTPEENFTYCTKTESRNPEDGSGPFEFGNIGDVKTQGTRSDLISAFRFIQEARALGSFSELDFALAHTAVWAKYPHLVNRCFGLTAPTNGGRVGGTIGYRIPSTALPQSEVPLLGGVDDGGGRPGGVSGGDSFANIYVELHIGQSRSGKSSGLRRAYPHAYWKSPGKWWDGYRDQATVIFDDIDGSWFTCSELLRILNPFTYRVETKGSTFDLQALHFALSSNIHPHEWYREHFERHPDHREALQNRINLVVCYTKGVAPWSMTGAEYFHSTAPTVIAHINDHTTHTMLQDLAQPGPMSLPNPLINHSPGLVDHTVPTQDPLTPTQPLNISIGSWEEDLITPTSTIHTPTADTPLSPLTDEDNMIIEFGQYTDY